MNLKDKILKQKIKVTKIDCQIPDLYVRDFTVASRQMFIEAETLYEQQLMGIVCLLCDEKGQPVFTVDDLDELREAPAEVIDDLSTAVMKVAFPQEDDKKKQEL